MNDFHIIVAPTITDEMVMGRVLAMRPLVVKGHMAAYRLRCLGASGNPWFCVQAGR